MTTQELEQTRAVRDRRSVTAALAAAGIVGPILFAVVALVQSLLREDHSLVAHPISALAAGASGWVQDVNFVVIGPLLIAYAIGLHLWMGLFQWVMVAVWFLCTVILALRLLRVSKDPDGDEAGIARSDANTKR